MTADDMPLTQALQLLHCHEYPRVMRGITAVNEVLGHRRLRLPVRLCLEQADRHEEPTLETELVQNRRDHLAMRAQPIIEGQDDSGLWMRPVTARQQPIQIRLRCRRE